MKSEDKINVKRTRVRNTLPGTEGSFRFALGSLSTCNLDTFSGRLANRVGYGKPVVKNVLGAVGAEVADIVATRGYRIKAFGFTFESAISGSVPSMDSPAGTDNVPYVAVYPSDELQSSPEDLKPAVSDDDGNDILIDQIQDVETRQANVIVGRREFQVNGWGLLSGLPGEGMTVKSKVDDAVATATVVSNYEGNIIRATLDRALPEGKATVEVLTRGRNADADLWPVTKSVTIVADEPQPTVDEPEVTTGYSSGYGNQPGVLHTSTDFILEGSHLGGASVKLNWTDEGGNEREQTVPAGEVVAEDESITLQQGDWLEACTTVDGIIVTFTVTTSHGSATYVATVVV